MFLLKGENFGKHCLPDDAWDQLKKCLFRLTYEPVSLEEAKLLLLISVELVRPAASESDFAKYQDCARNFMQKLPRFAHYSFKDLVTMGQSTQSFIEGGNAVRKGKDKQSAKSTPESAVQSSKRSAQRSEVRDLMAAQLLEDREDCMASLPGGALKGMAAVQALQPLNSNGRKLVRLQYQLAVRHKMKERIIFFEEKGIMDRL